MSVLQAVACLPYAPQRWPWNVPCCFSDLALLAFKLHHQFDVYSCFNFDSDVLALLVPLAGSP